MMKHFTVIGGPNSDELARKLAKKLHAKFLKADLKVFPDGESKITIKGKMTGIVIVVQSTSPPVDSNLIQCLSIISRAKKYSDQVYAVVPYMGYAKQDKEFLPGEVVTMKVVASLFKAVGATGLVVIDMHSLVGLNYFKIPKKNLSAVKVLANYFKNIKLVRPLIVSPDLFWEDKAKEFSNYLGTNSIALNKQRDRKTGRLVIKSTLPENIKGRDVVLLDDMVSSGGSIIKAIKFLQRKNLGKIYVACTHAILSGNAEKKLKDAGVYKIISSNTVTSKTNKVDVSEIIAYSIKKW